MTLSVGPPVCPSVSQSCPSADGRALRRCGALVRRDGPIWNPHSASPLASRASRRLYGAAGARAAGAPTAGAWRGHQAPGGRRPPPRPAALRSLPWIIPRPPALSPSSARLSLSPRPPPRSREEMKIYVDVFLVLVWSANGIGPFHLGRPLLPRKGPRGRAAGPQGRAGG